MFKNIKVSVQSAAIGSTAAAANVLNKVKVPFQVVAIGFVVTLTLAAVITIKTSVWNECRSADHSWFYCWHLISS